MVWASNFHPTSPVSLSQEPLLTDWDRDRRGAGRAAGDAVVFGKSLGSMAAPVIAERGLPAIWFTPLLTDPAVVAALRGAAWPCLLAGGTADPYWDGEIARGLDRGRGQLNGVRGRSTSSPSTYRSTFSL